MIHFRYSRYRSSLFFGITLIAASCIELYKPGFMLLNILRCGGGMFYLLRATLPEAVLADTYITYFSFLSRRRLALDQIQTAMLWPQTGGWARSRTVKIVTMAGDKISLEPEDQHGFLDELALRCPGAPIGPHTGQTVMPFFADFKKLGPRNGPFAWMSLVYDVRTNNIHDPDQASSAPPPPLAR